VATARGFIYKGMSAPRRISSKAFSAIGRPSPKVWTDKGQKQTKSKMSVTRVMRRDPARGRTLPLADKITDTHIDTGVPTTSISSRDRTAPAGANQTRVSNKGVNRSLKKR
jgi:hypothetical protein